ncbi:MAG TPA: hypothetical protein VE093_24425 [Polyangiaceae bacterium]|nr:hypothetical protein [Polyangiaceae bacterium]
MSFYLEFDDGSDPEFGRVLEFGWSGLVAAARIWDFLGSEKGEALQEMLDEELAIPEGQSMSWVSQSQIARLIDLLRGIETEAKGKLVDAAWKVLPEHIERVEREAPDLGERDTGSSGPYLSFARPLSEALSTRAFLERAQRLGSDITIE